MTSVLCEVWKTRCTVLLFIVVLPLFGAMTLAYFSYQEETKHLLSQVLTDQDTSSHEYHKQTPTKNHLAAFVQEYGSGDLHFLIQHPKTSARAFLPVNVTRSSKEYKKALKILHRAGYKRKSYRNWQSSPVEHDPEDTKNWPPDDVDHLYAEVHPSVKVADLSHFWESTGFCPPDPHQKACDWFLSDDMLHNLAYIGAVPHAGIRNVRVHWLLDAVYIQNVARGNPVYNFTCLDTFVQRLHRNGLKPGFEFMGNPSDYFSNFENRTQVFQWKDLVHQIASRYIAKYGLYYVSQWNFESWNEPKIKSFDGINFTAQGFLNYYDACSEGLKQASPQLRLGAPSGGCKDDYSLKRYCWVLLNHIDHGVNYFTGERGVRANYISVHKKGWGENNSQIILARELHFGKLLKRHLPGLVSTPLVNDEADPLVTWSKALPWRADSTYAGIVAKVVAQHQQEFFVQNNTGIHYRMLSNDNGFLSYQPQPFSQRTLLARFQVNDTQPPHIQFIRKPAHSVMGLLALLGNTQILTHIHNDYNRTIGVLSTKHTPGYQSTQDSWQVAVLVYYSVDSATSHQLPAVLKLRLNITDLPSAYVKDMKYVVYLLDDLHGNPWKVWLNARSPKTPSPSTFEAMRQNQDLVRVRGPESVRVSPDGSFIVQRHISLPSVSVVHICRKAARPPDQVTDVVIYSITCNQVLIVWSDSCVNSKCILQYDVEYSLTGTNDTFHKVNTHDSIFTAFVYAPSLLGFTDCGLVRGFYRVRAVDYWLRGGIYSIVIQH